jgi:hypothetical protein
VKVLLLICCLFLLTFHHVNGQEDSSAILSPNCKSRQIAILSGYAGIYAGGMTALYQLWYKNYSQSGFHFFNDNKEWLQMDKAGHVYSAYHLGEFGYNSAKYACFSENQSLWLGSSYGLLFLTTIEIFDGFSSGWGASAGDFIANTSGYLLFTGQQYFWNEQKFRLKFSYSPGKYAQYRPELLGENQFTRVIKDYNAQTYWFSFSPAVFTTKKETLWPEWLCLSLGYSGDGMIGGAENPSFVNGKPLPDFTRQRQFYCSLDIDFSKIRTNSKGMKLLFYGFNMIKFPFPAISYDRRNGLSVLPVGF